MPKADIHLESPQSIIWAMDGSGHAVFKMCDTEWHLPDKRITDIPIDPNTNVPLIQDFVCTVLLLRKQHFKMDSKERTFMAMGCAYLVMISKTPMLFSKTLPLTLCGYSPMCHRVQGR